MTTMKIANAVQLTLKAASGLMRRLLACRVCRRGDRRGAGRGAVFPGRVDGKLEHQYDVSSDLRVHAGYSRYFTPPPTEKIDTTSVQKFLGTTNALPSDANTAVKSERSNYYDLGVAYQLTPQITVGVDGYYRDVRLLQDEGQFGNALIFSAFNYAKGRISGLEFSTTYRDKGLSAYGNLGFTRARGKTVETGRRVPLG
jgi:outer membrane receptor protein involved in Fe transport